MRPIYPATVTALLMGCMNGGANETMFDANGADAAGGTSFGEDTNDPSDAGASSDTWNGELQPATQIASTEASVLGVTTDGWAVFRSADVLMAAPVGAEEAAVELTAKPGSVLIKGSVVFNWADVDWEKGIGDLSVWTAEGGPHELGPTPYVEGLVAASSSGRFVVYPANTTATTTDLMIATNDFAAPEALIPSLGLGSETTCAASIGFVGERLFVGFCEEGSRVASIARFEATDAGWQRTLIAENALGTWSADESGERVFYQSSDYGGYVAEAGDSMLVDAGVGQGQIVPDGSAVLYSVGDQLRRSAIPEVNPVPIVTTGYKQPVGFSTDFGLALYSTTVSYEEGTRRDLLLVSTQSLNTEPIALVGEPVAALGRSSMTADGRFVFYLTEMGPSGGTLHVASSDGSEMLSLPDVAEVLAANESTLVFSDHASDPEKYPVVADLKVVNLAHETEPRLVEASILGPHDFYLSADRQNVVYVRSGVDREPEAADAKGLYAREVR